MLPADAIAPNPRPLVALPVGTVRSRRPYNQQPFNVPWTNVTRWMPQIDAALARYPEVRRWLGEDVYRFYWALMLIESDGHHVYPPGRPRAGQVVEGGDPYGGGTAKGVMQIKNQLHQWLDPQADWRTPEGNIRLGTAFLDRALARRGGDWARVIAEDYHPGVSPNGTTPQTYVQAMRELMAEARAATPEPVAPTPPVITNPPDEPPLTFGRVPHPPVQDRIVTNSRAWDDLGPRQIVGVCTHSMIGTLQGTDSYFRGAAAGSALTDYGVGGATDGALDGVIYRWNDPRGRRAPWANGPASDLEGDGPAFVRAYGVGGINRDLVSIERSDGGNTEAPVSPRQFESIAALIAYWMDQAQVPWDAYPINPAKSVVTHLEHWEIGPKQCPFTPMRSRTTELQARVRAILKQHQTDAPTPSDPDVPPPAPVDPGDGYPAGMTVELATKMFGQLHRVSIGQRYGFDASNKGIVSMAWLARGDEDDAFPRADEWLDMPDGRRIFTFTNGWILVNDPSNEKRDWYWAGDAEGENEAPND